MIYRVVFRLQNPGWNIEGLKNRVPTLAPPVCPLITCKRGRGPFPPVRVTFGPDVWRLTPFELCLSSPRSSYCSDCSPYMMMGCGFPPSREYDGFFRIHASLSAGSGSLGVPSVLRLTESSMCGSNVSQTLLFLMRDRHTPPFSAFAPTSFPGSAPRRVWFSPVLFPAFFSLMMVRCFRLWQVPPHSRLRDFKFPILSWSPFVRQAGFLSSACSLLYAPPCLTSKSMREP